MSITLTKKQEEGLKVAIQRFLDGEKIYCKIPWLGITFWSNKLKKQINIL